MTRKTIVRPKPKKMTIDELAIIVSNGFVSLEERIETRLKEEIGREIGGLRTEMNERFVQVDQRFDIVDRRLTRMENSLDRLEPIISEHENRINRLEDKVFVSA